MARYPRINSALFIAGGLIVAFWVWGISAYFLDPAAHLRVREVFSYTYGIVALAGGLIGLYVSKGWGGYKSLVGRAILMLSLGLLSQELGQAVYTYYIEFIKIDIPYPSLGDVGWFLTIPFYIYGAWLLAQASGTKVTLRTFGGKIYAVLIPLVMLAFSYSIFLKEYQFDWSYPLVIFFDFGYPLGHSLYISMTILAYLLSRKLLGGVMKKTILLVLLAMVFQYLGDFVFLYQVITETFYLGGLYDYMFLASYSAMTVAIISFMTTLNSRTK